MGVEDYVRLNGKYLKEAEELLAEGDYVQASEKLWGAAAEMVKAVAAARGIMLGTHRSLWEFVHKLDEERPGMNLIEGFRAAESLHVNFYEDHLPEKVVELTVEQVKEFIEKMKKLLQQTT
ncbi:MAG: PaREP1 family protein [Candidatus Caldarchaeum sp.]